MDTNPIVNGSHGKQKIKLSTLMDFIIQKAYHDLNVLTEILPRKGDVERKIAIYRYSASMRQQFVRLLAIVKWATKAEKIEKCFQLCDFLEQEGKIFVDTADELYRIANEMLPQAKLPYFDLISAAEVLSRGSYSLLPTCIKDKIIPLPPMTRDDKKTTLQKLNEVIKDRLLRSNVPQGISKTVIGNGQLTLTVEGEFEVVLTLLGDDPALPWRLLSIKILIEEADIGDYLCLSLQLEVLHSQAENLVAHRWAGYVKLIDHLPGGKLILSYWRKKEIQDQLTLSEDRVDYTLTVYIDQEKNDTPLSVEHFPVQEELNTSLNKLDLKKRGGLSIETLLMEAIEKRSLSKLMEVKHALQSSGLNLPVKLERDRIPSLVVNLIDDDDSSERLLLSVDTKSGDTKAMFSSDLSLIDENVNVNKLCNIIADAKIEAHLRICLQALAPLPVTCNRRLPIHCDSFDLLDKISKHRLFVKLHDLDQYYLIIGVECSKDLNVKESFYLMNVNDSTLGNSSEDVAFHCASFIKIRDVKSCQISDSEYHLMNVTEGVKNSPSKKRKFEAAFGLSVGSTKHIKFARTRVVDMIHFTLSTVAHAQLCKGLQRANFLYEKIYKDIHGDNVLKILWPPKFPDLCSPIIMDSILKNLIDFRVRLVDDGFQWKWLAEVTFKNHPVTALKASKSIEEEHIRFIVSYDTNHKWNPSTGDISLKLLDDWKGIIILYRLTSDLAEALQGNISIVICTVLDFMVRISWCDKMFKLRFSSISNANANFGENPHNLILDHLQHKLNNSKDIVKLLEKLSTAALAFTVLPLSCDHLRIQFRHFFIMDVHLKNSNSVIIHDMGKNTEVAVIPGFKEFITKFIETVDTSMAFTNDISESNIMDTEDTYPNRPNSADNSHADATLAIEALKEMTSTVESPTLPFSTSPFISGHNSSPLFIFSTSDFIQADNSPSGRRIGENHSSPQASVPNQLAAIVSGNENQTFTGNYLNNPPTKLQKQEYWASLSKVSTLTSARSDSVEISQAAFAKLLEPVSTDESLSGCLLSPFERYLSCAFLLQQIKRSAKSCDVSVGNETSRIVNLRFSMDNMSAEAMIDVSHLPTLRLGLLSSRDNFMKEDDVRTLVEFFRLKVASYPYKAGSLSSFLTLITAPVKILEDCINIMKLELFPDPKRSWKVCWCLTIPPNCPKIAPLGFQAVALKAKLLIVLQFWKYGVTPLVIPIVCSVQDGSVNVLDSVYPDGVDSNLLSAVKSILKSRKDVYPSSRDRCQLFETVREILAKL
ncbi:uncharacterized protein TRIADDRAFT_52232 [Trichoplax adhaerens]|uniref:Mediator of RNA polymerase II transcription subunit 14 n=1 Tax=Trichoplax adhaerens TaxID=10228 RepID=B3RM45_TRIAD|nr:hypothetical protein TRIADDRAFT_52232 [Trichoplax adhaerens]EDV28899.1 hypothetical protein TRIADDRAFT_52232 [Trichoplax adhaerens]|eukprot:XP_002108101.1 hypothetical protein TRIADDRAFT_52232 [Trichoplax adhaerens]